MTILWSGAVIAAAANPSFEIISRRVNIFLLLRCDRLSNMFYPERPDAFANCARETALPSSAERCGCGVRYRNSSMHYCLNGAPCFATRACPDLVNKRDCSYISIHVSLEIDEISLPIGSSGKSSGDSK